MWRLHNRKILFFLSDPPTDPNYRYSSYSGFFIVTVNPDLSNQIDRSIDRGSELIEVHEEQMLRFG